MQQLLCCRAPLQASAWWSMLWGRGVRNPPTGPLQCIRTLSPSPRWLSTSGVAGAAAPRKSGGGEEPRRTAVRTQADPGSHLDSPAETDPLQDSSISLFQRFKRTFKQYGKVMIPVHLVTSSAWFGMFYYAAMKGVNVVPVLEVIGFPEKIVNLLESSQSGYAITAYAMYKVATPARYAVTLGGTSLSVKYLRKKGYMSTPPPVKEYLQDKMEATRERISEKMEETKERLSGKMEETKDRFSGRMEETKDKITEKFQETKDKVSFRKKAE